ncbi:MAG: hypothetical protein AAFR28_11645 [Pseudomonadota bacterium]
MKHLRRAAFSAIEQTAVFKQTLRPEDPGWEAEDAVIRQCASVFAELYCLVEIRNQARERLWFKDRFGQDDAPFGLDEIFAFMIKPNRALDNAGAHRKKSGARAVGVAGASRDPMVTPDR